MHQVKVPNRFNKLTKDKDVWKIESKIFQNFRIIKGNKSGNNIPEHVQISQTK